MKFKKITFFKKSVDKQSGLWYITIKEREKQQQRKEDKNVQEKQQRDKKLLQSNL